MSPPTLHEVETEQDAMRQFATTHGVPALLDYLGLDRHANQINNCVAALREIVRREATSDYTSIYAAPSEFARIAKRALARLDGIERTGP